MEVWNQDAPSSSSQGGDNHSGDMPMNTPGDEEEAANPPEEERQNLPACNDGDTEEETGKGVTKAKKMTSGMYVAKLMQQYEKRN